MSKPRVLLTGAAGYISSQLLPAFRERYDLVLLDVTKEAKGGAIGDIVEVDLSNPDVDAYRAHFEGLDAIVHNGHHWGEVRAGPPLQWLPDQEPGDVDGYYVERVNLDMAFHVLKLALEENVRRVVITSSNHAADWYESKLHHGKMDLVAPDTYPLSDNYYGWAKATYEHLGFVFASGRFGRALENVHIRIGAPRPIVGEKLKDDPVTYRRHLGAFISARDLAQLYVKSIETEDIRNPDGVPFQIFYGISNNTRAFWSLVNAREVIGYAPEDDSERLFATDIENYLRVPGRTF
jgi:nucleoside-diphosphate-sugar epimerase